MFFLPNSRLPLPLQAALVVVELASLVVLPVLLDVCSWKMDFLWWFFFLLKQVVVMLVTLIQLRD